MAKLYKEKQKALKGPDQFQTRMSRLVRWIQENPVPVTVALAPIFLAAFLILAWNWYQGYQVQSRRHELSKINLILEQEKRKAYDAMEAIEKEITALRGATEPGADSAQAKPEDPKIKELEQKMSEIRPDHTASGQRYYEFFKENKGNPEGWIAGLRATSFLVTKERLDEAEVIAGEIAQASKKHALFQTQAGLVRASLLEDLKRFDEGLAVCDALLPTVYPELKATVLLAKGRLQVAKSDPDAAQATFKELIEKHGMSPEADQARVLMAVSKLRL